MVTFAEIKKLPTVAKRAKAITAGKNAIHPSWKNLSGVPTRSNGNQSLLIAVVTSSLHSEPRLRVFFAPGTGTRLDQPRACVIRNRISRSVRRETTDDRVHAHDYVPSLLQKA